MLCAVNIPREQEIIVAAITIALLVFTLFQCPPTYVQSKPSDNFALRQGIYILPNQQMFRTMLFFINDKMISRAGLDVRVVVWRS